MILFIPLLLVLVVPQLIGRALGRQTGTMATGKGALVAALPALIPFILLALFIAASDLPPSLGNCAPPLCEEPVSWGELLLVLVIPTFLVALLLGWWGFRAGRAERDEGVIRR